MIGLVLTILGVVGAVAWIARRVWRWVQLARERTALRICEDFAKAFPGRCLTCSLHRHELEQGYGGFGVDYGPVPHECIEGNSKPLPAELPRAITQRR